MVILSYLKISQEAKCAKTLILYATLINKNNNIYFQTSNTLSQNNQPYTVKRDILTREQNIETKHVFEKMRAYIFQEHKTDGIINKTQILKKTE